MKNYHEPGKPKPTPYKPKYGPLDNTPVKAEKWPKVLELDAELMDEADAESEVTGGNSFLETGATMQKKKKLPDCKPGQTKDLKDIMGRDTCNPIKFCKPKPTPVPTLSPEQLKAKRLREFRAKAKALKVKPATGYMKLKRMNTVLPAYTPTPTPAMQAIPANTPMLIAVPKARRCLYVHPKHNALALARCDHALKREKFYYDPVTQQFKVGGPPPSGHTPVPTKKPAPKPAPCHGKHCPKPVPTVPALPSKRPLCLDVDTNTKLMVISPCDAGQHTQRFGWDAQHQTLTTSQRLCSGIDRAVIPNLMAANCNTASQKIEFVQAQ